MKFYKNIKLIISIIFMVMLFVNIVMYFYMQNTTNIFGYEINCLYAQLLFIIVESILMSAVYGKKQGLLICLIYVLVVAVNLIFILFNLA